MATSTNPSTEPQTSSSTGISNVAEAEKAFPNLHVTDAGAIPDDGEPNAVIKYGPRDPFDPCVACGWTLDQDSCARYKSSIKLFYAASNRGVWALGNSFVLKERSTTPPSHEAANLQFLNEYSQLPVPYLVKDWTEGNRYFTITSRIEGETLEEAWPKLRTDEKDRIAMQAANLLNEMRKLTSSRIGAVGGKNLFEAGLFPDKPDGQEPLTSDEAFWNEMARPLNGVDAQLLQQLKDNMPACGPYTFTHADLTFCNIMVKDGNLAGFIDFERSGFFPVWYEYVCLRYGYSGGDREWKDLLASKMAQFPTAANFFMARGRLRGDPSGGSAKELMRDLLDKADRCPAINLIFVSIGS